MVMVPVSIITVVLVIFLSFHVFLLCSGRTTKAMIKSIKQRRTTSGAEGTAPAAAEGGSGGDTAAARQRLAAAGVAEGAEGTEGQDRPQDQVDYSGVCTALPRLRKNADAANPVLCAKGTPGWWATR